MMQIHDRLCYRSLASVDKVALLLFSLFVGQAVNSQEIAVRGLNDMLLSTITK